MCRCLCVIITQLSREAAKKAGISIVEGWTWLFGAGLAQIPLSLLLRGGVTTGPGGPKHTDTDQVY